METLTEESVGSVSTKQLLDEILGLPRVPEAMPPNSPDKSKILEENVENVAARPPTESDSEVKQVF